MGAGTNVQRRRAHADLARQRAEQARLASAAAARRRRWLIVGGSSLGVLAVVGAIVLAAVLRGAPEAGDGGKPGIAAPAALVSDVTDVPSSVLDTIGAGDAKPVIKQVDEAPLGTDTPQVLYVGAEYCPFCAAERWALVQALSRFGTFRDLSLTTSAVDEVFPSTATFTFHGASYESDYLTFVGKELYTNQPAGVRPGSYEPLDELTAAESATFRGHTNAFPFTDINGGFILVGANFDPGVLHELTAAQIAKAMNQPNSAVARSVVGAANVLTAAICVETGGQPATVCRAPGVSAAANTLPQ